MLVRVVQRHGIFTPVTLLVGWNTHPGPGGLHPCGHAHRALRDAGYDPEVVKARGLRLLPECLNRTEGRREAKRLTGTVTVPVLVTDDGQVIADSKEIVAWASENHAGSSAARQGRPEHRARSAANLRWPRRGAPRARPGARESRRARPGSGRSQARDGPARRGVGRDMGGAPHRRTEEARSQTRNG